MRTLRRVIPQRVRRYAAGPAGRLGGFRIRRRLARMAASGRPILAGPWLGEVGFEILYWAPFLRWAAAEFEIAPERLTVLSRGGTAAWYAPAAGRYEEVFDHVSPGEFRQWRGEHLGEIGEQKQTRITSRERLLVDRVLARSAPDTVVLHPSVMHRLLNPFWWRHLDEQWVDRHTRYRQLDKPARAGGVALPDRYIAAKFYYNDCFPATDANRAFVTGIMKQLAREAPIVQLSTGAALDDHGDWSSDGDAITVSDIADNLRVQTAVVANASAFVGTYGGFAYLAPFHGVPCTAYFSDASAFSRAHLHMAHHALEQIGTRTLLDVRPTVVPTT